MRLTSSFGQSLFYALNGFWNIPITRRKPRESVENLAGFLNQPYRMCRLLPFNRFLGEHPYGPMKIAGFVTYGLPSFLPANVPEAYEGIDGR